MIGDLFVWLFIVLIFLGLDFDPLSHSPANITDADYPSSDREGRTS